MLKFITTELKNSLEIFCIESLEVSITYYVLIRLKVSKHLKPTASTGTDLPVSQLFLLIMIFTVNKEITQSLGTPRNF